ncbi:hypothetical protein Hdeb2414_s0011g00360061 [Helianthus debilis subsp. tardiflorus]
MQFKFYYLEIGTLLFSPATKKLKSYQLLKIKESSLQHVVTEMDHQIRTKLKSWIERVLSETLYYTMEIWKIEELWTSQWKMSL